MPSSQYVQARQHAVRADDDTDANVDAVFSPRNFAWPSMWRSMRLGLRSSWPTSLPGTRGSSGSCQAAAHSMQVAQQVEIAMGVAAPYQLDQSPESRCILCGAGRVSCNEQYDTCSLCCTPAGKTRLSWHVVVIPSFSHYCNSIQ